MTCSFTNGESNSCRYRPGAFCRRGLVHTFAGVLIPLCFSADAPAQQSARLLRPHIGRSGQGRRSRHGHEFVQSPPRSSPSAAAVQKSVETPLDGRFLVELAPGSYVLTVHKPGFAPHTESVSLSASAETNRDITLRLAPARIPSR